MIEDSKSSVFFIIFEFTLFFVVMKKEQNN